MPTSLTRSFAALRPRVWLDFYDYAAALLHAPVPWLDQAAFSAFYSKTQGLLHSDVIALPVEAIADALLTSNTGLCVAMTAKSRSVYPLRRLLEDEPLRKAVLDLLVVLHASHPEHLLALTIPSPRRWLATAYHAAHGEQLATQIACDTDEIDGASVYVADFLRSFAGNGIDVLLLCETPGEAPADGEQLGAYQSVINAASHYRWEIGLLDAGARSPASYANSLNFSVTPYIDDAGLSGQMLDSGYWDSGSLPEITAGQFYYAAIPAQAHPELVLDRLAALRTRSTR